MRLNLDFLFPHKKPKRAIRDDYNLIGELCSELNIKKPHREYDEWDICIDGDNLHYVTNDDLIQKDFSDNIWLPVQLNGQTCRLQIDDLIATALKLQCPDKIREIYLDWLCQDKTGPQQRWGNELVLKLEFYRDILNRDILNKNLKGKDK